MSGFLGWRHAEGGRAIHEVAAPVVETLVAPRAALRTRRAWELADRVRDRRAAAGIAPDGAPSVTHR